MCEQLLATPAPGGVLIQASQGEVCPISSNIFRQLVLQGLDSPRVWNAEPAKELVGLENLHVSRYQVTQVLPDQVELVHVRLPGPQGLSLHKFNKNTT